jgi:hypothetical protein
MLSDGRRSHPGDASIRASSASIMLSSPKCSIAVRLGATYCANSANIRARDGILWFIAMRAMPTIGSPPSAASLLRRVRLFSVPSGRPWPEVRSAQKIRGRLGVGVGITGPHGDCQVCSLSSLWAACLAAGWRSRHRADFERAMQSGAGSSDIGSDLSRHKIGPLAAALIGPEASPGNRSRVP